MHNLVISKLDEELAARHPVDGFCVTRVRAPLRPAAGAAPANPKYRYSLHLEMCNQGQRCVLVEDDACFFDKSDPSMFDCGAEARLHMLADSVCDYLNSGGTPEEAKDLWRVFAGLANRLHFQPVNGYELIDVYRDGEVLTRVFARPGELAPLVRWVEDNFFEAITPEEYAKEQEDGNAQ